MADACGHTNPSGAKFCLECAARGSRCPQCRAELASCGAALSTQPSPANATQRLEPPL